MYRRGKGKAQKEIRRWWRREGRRSTRQDWISRGSVGGIMENDGVTPGLISAERWKAPTKTKTRANSQIRVNDKQA